MNLVIDIEINNTGIVLTAFLVFILSNISTLSYTWVYVHKKYCKNIDFAADTCERAAEYLYDEEKVEDESITDDSTTDDSTTDDSEYSDEDDTTTYTDENEEESQNVNEQKTEESDYVTVPNDCEPLLNTIKERNGESIIRMVNYWGKSSIYGTSSDERHWVYSNLKKNINAISITNEDNEKVLILWPLK